MNITWYGQSCFKIDIKSDNEEVSIITDPFDATKAGLKLPRKLTADIVLQQGEKLEYPVEKKDGGKPFIINCPGEYEIKGVFVYTIPLTEKNGDIKHIFWLEAEHIVILHTGALANSLTETDMQDIENVDILTLPVGGNDVLESKPATKLLSSIEPRIVIPMNYKIKGLKQKLDSIDSFLSASGSKSETMPKLKITKKDLPIDETRIVVLENQ